MNTRIFHLHALSALHVGTGQGIGAVDLPIARSRATNLPLVPGSALKGVLRDEAKEKWHVSEDDIQALFGADSQADKENIHAGAAAFGDAHLLLLPIRSFAGTVAFATCPFILQRYARDVRGILPESPKVPVLKDSASVPDNTVLRVSDSRIALEDLDIGSETSTEAKQWAEHIAAAVYPENMANSEAWREQLHYPARQHILILSRYRHRNPHAHQNRPRNAHRQRRRALVGRKPARRKRVVRHFSH